VNAEIRRMRFLLINPLMRRLIARGRFGDQLRPMLRPLTRNSSAISGSSTLAVVSAFDLT
jgi:hypothetical protein